MNHCPAELYLCLQDQGPVVAETSPRRRLAALLAIAMLLVATSVMWLAATDAVATTGSKPTASSADLDDDDEDGDGDGDGSEAGTDANTETGTATQSQDATNTDGNTGVSTKAATATQSADPTNTGKTGVSTKGR